MGNPELSPDVLRAIAKLLKGMEEFGAFRLANSLLRNLATIDDFKGLRLRRSVPYLMLPANEDGTECEFFSLAKENVVEEITLPEAKAKKWIESQGWLLIFGGHHRLEKGMSLLHPFTNVEIKLPNEVTFMDYNWIETKPYEFIQKMVLSARPSETSDFAVAVIYGACREWGFWKPGNESWTKISIPSTSYSQVKDITYLNSQFFAINSAGEIWSCDVNGPDPTMSQNVLSVPCDGDSIYLVGSSGKLLVVVWHLWKFVTCQQEEKPSYNNNNNHRGMRTSEEFINGWGENRGFKGPGFDIFAVNPLTKTWKEVKDLGGKALFIGYSASVVVEATRGIKPDHIYYAGDELMWNTVLAWSYSLIEGRREDLIPRSNSPAADQGGYLPPVWIAPTF